MISHNSENGSVNISAAVYTDIAGTAASNCFGVKGMAARSLTDGVYHLLRKESVGKGVHVTYHEDNSISIDLHIIVDNGVAYFVTLEDEVNDTAPLVTVTT